MKTKILSLLTLLTNLIAFSQSQFQNVGTSNTGNAERITNFSVTDATNELLEVTNSTNIDGQFIPSLWAHHQADNRYVFRHFITTNSAQDNGNIPMMIYRAEIRNNLNLTAGPTGNFPWGTTAANVVNRPLFAWENGNTQLMRILANGYLGIGTTTPTSLLHTNGTVRFENIPTTLTNTYVLTTDANGNVSRQLSTSFGSGLTNSCATTNFVLKKGATDLTCSQIFDNGTNIGIGTIAPTSLFHTNGTLRFENVAITAANTYVLTTDANGNVSRQLASSFGGGGITNSCVATNFVLKKGATDLTCSQIFDNGSNVGIGTITPSALFHTNGSVRLENIATSTANTYVLTTDANGNVSRQLASSFGGGGITNSCVTTNFVLKKGATDLTCSQIFDNGTNVGIGTTTPTSLFHTNGTVRFENLTDATTPFRILGTDNSGNVFEYNPTTLTGGGTNDYDWLRPDNTFATSINDNIYTNGKVGINTSVFPSQVGDVDVSSYSLFAKGGILTEEVRVALSSDWADYVFDKEYKLESLKNVEAFINENKHLKDIPSAKEVEKNGIELGEMNKLLLLKVEELTLYLIELNKKVEQQNEEIKKLKSK